MRERVGFFGDVTRFKFLPGARSHFAKKRNLPLFADEKILFFL